MSNCHKLNFQETFVTSEEIGRDLEHVEVLQKKFEEFQKDLQSHEDRVTEVNQLAEKLLEETHPEEEKIKGKQDVSRILFLRKIYKYGIIAFKTSKEVFMLIVYRRNQINKRILKLTYTEYPDGVILVPFPISLFLVKAETRLGAFLYLKNRLPCCGVGLT
jgi:hypothetical protein